VGIPVPGQEDLEPPVVAVGHTNPVQQHEDRAG
jgi:hypothetical protein